MNALEPWHLLIIGLVVVVLFGAKRLPDSARSLGRSMKIFRAEMNEARGEAHELAPTAPVASPVHASAPPVAEPIVAPTAFAPIAAASMPVPVAVPVTADARVGE